MEVWQYENVGLWKCGSIGVWNVRVWECGSMGVWECGRMDIGVWECRSIGVWEYENVMRSTS